jgi:hypothetical protein
MRKRRTIGQSPLDAVVPNLTATLDREAAVLDRGPAKQRLTIHLPVELIERVKNAVYWTPGLTLAGLAEEALRTAVDELEAGRGEAYARRASELKGGRPMK